MIEKWQEINFADPFEKGPRAYFTGTGGKEAEDLGLEAAEFELIPQEQTSVFSHPWLGELRIQYQDTAILTLSERIKNLNVEVKFYDKAHTNDLFAFLISSTVLQPGLTREPLTFYPGSFGYIQVGILLPDKQIEFSFYGLTERVQGSIF